MVKPITLDEQLCFAIYKAQKQYNHFYAQALAPFKLTYPQYISPCCLYMNTVRCRLNKSDKRLNWTVVP